MKYQQDKLSRFLARFSILIVACFSVFAFYFIFQARMNIPSYSELAAWIQFLIGFLMACSLLWVIAALFEPQNDENKNK